MLGFLWSEIERGEFRVRFIILKRSYQQFRRRSARPIVHLIEDTSELCRERTVRLPKVERNLINLHTSQRGTTRRCRSWFASGLILDGIGLPSTAFDLCFWLMCNVSLMRPGNSSHFLMHVPMNVQHLSVVVHTFRSPVEFLSSLDYTKPFHATILRPRNSHRRGPSLFYSVRSDGIWIDRWCGACSSWTVTSADPFSFPAWQSSARNHVQHNSLSRE